MLAAGLFEYNFGDSEFLMLFLLLVTLPYAADRQPGHRVEGRHPGEHRPGVGWHVCEYHSPRGTCWSGIRRLG